MVRITVCMKEVPGQAVPKRLDPVSYCLVRGVGGELNAGDYYALEAALQIRDSGEDVEIVVVSMGPESVVRSLRHALAMGADRAVVLSDGALAGADVVVTSAALAAVLAREAPDLVLFGSQASDSGGGVLGSSVAEGMGVPFVSNVTRVVCGSRETVEVVRQTEMGYERIELSRPCALSVSGSGLVPRFPSLRGMVMAKQKEVGVLSLEDVGGARSRDGVRSMTEVLGVVPAPARRTPVMIEEGEGAAERIVELLVERRLL